MTRFFIWLRWYFVQVATFFQGCAKVGLAMTVGSIWQRKSRQLAGFEMWLKEVNLLSGRCGPSWLKGFLVLIELGGFVGAVDQVF